jgi:hypothetical protein
LLNPDGTVVWQTGGPQPASIVQSNGPTGAAGATGFYTVTFDRTNNLGCAVPQFIADTSADVAAQLVYLDCTQATTIFTIYDQSTSGGVNTANSVTVTFTSP